MPDELKRGTDQLEYRHPPGACRGAAGGAHRRRIPRARTADALCRPGDLARLDDRAGARPQARRLRSQHRHPHQQSAPQARPARPARIPKSRTCAARATPSPGPERYAARMHSLFLRIFVLFWLAMALIVGGSIATTFTIALANTSRRNCSAGPPSPFRHRKFWRAAASAR